MDSWPEININTTTATPRRRTAYRVRGRKPRQRQTAWIAGSLLAVFVVAVGVAYSELGKLPPRKRASNAFKKTTNASTRVQNRAKGQARKPASAKPASAKAITVEQFQSVPQGAMRFRVLDVFGSPLDSTHDFEEVERFGSNGEIFGSEFVNTFVIAYPLSDRPGHIALFMFQGQSTNPPLVDKQIRGQ